MSKITQLCLILKVVFCKSKLHSLRFDFMMKASHLSQRKSHDLGRLFVIHLKLRIGSIVRSIGMNSIQFFYSYSFFYPSSLLLPKYHHILHDLPISLLIKLCSKHQIKFSFKERNEIQNKKKQSLCENKSIENEMLFCRLNFCVASIESSHHKHF